MNRVGIYYAFWTQNWDADFVPFVAKVKKLGFDVLEVNAGTVANMDNSQRDRLKSGPRARNRVDVLHRPAQSI